MRKLILLTIAAAAIAFAISANAETSSRIRTTNTTESAPLNFVNRSFAKLEPSMKAEFETERLTFKARSAQISKDEIRTLLINITGGPDSSAIASLEEISGPAQAQSAAEDAVEHGSAFGNDQEAALQQRFVSAVRSAVVARRDVKIFEAELMTEGRSVHALILCDEETHDLLVLDMSPRAS